MGDQIFIQVRFTQNTDYGTYSDALYFTPEEYATKTVSDFNLLKKQRIDNFINTVKNPLPQVEPTKEELQKYANSLQSQLDEIKLRIVSK